jgi:sarcosine oxidase subunit gamma
VSAPDPAGAPLRIAQPRRTLVQFAARRGRAADLAAAIRTTFALELPPPGHATVSGDLAALWSQPNAWLLSAPPGVEGALATELKAACCDAASVVDQTHGRAILTLSGPSARGVLAKLCRIDLHPRAFGPNCVAATPVAELSCLLHQRDDAPSFDLIVFSTFAVAFAEAVRQAAAETGYEAA